MGTHLNVTDISFGDHLSSIYQNKEQQFSLIVPFVMDGLNNNNKCIYVVNENSREEVIFEFENAGFNIETYIASKQFVILTAEDTYLKDGYFGVEKILNFIEETNNTAIKDGYNGLRGIGEMSWALADIAINEKLIEYEIKLNKFLTNKRIVLLCQYNESKFSHDILNNIVRTHESIVIYGKLYKNKYFYIAPSYFNQAKKLPADSYQTIIDTIIEE
ncbi:MAG: MEDS domain-containing protein [Candidatus Roizmanbacteria bacterium]|nr:MEDS domain-containing protein [Candidatus Roizmanbacteria bacterium]